MGERKLHTYGNRAAGRSNSLKEQEKEATTKDGEAMAGSEGEERSGLSELHDERRARLTEKTDAAVRVAMGEFVSATPRQ